MSTAPSLRRIFATLAFSGLWSAARAQDAARVRGAADENLRLQNLFDGMKVYAGIIAHLGRVWVETP